MLFVRYSLVSSDATLPAAMFKRHADDESDNEKGSHKFVTAYCNTSLWRLSFSILFAHTCIAGCSTASCHFPELVTDIPHWANVTPSFNSIVRVMKPNKAVRLHLYCQSVPMPNLSQIVKNFFLCVRV